MTSRLPSGAAAYAEVHWRAFHPWFFDVAEEVEWRHTEPFTLQGVAVSVFDPPLTLLHLAAHFAQHGFSEAWILRDVAAAWNTWHRVLDGDALLALARETGTVSVLDFALSAATDLELLAAPAPAIGDRRAAVLRRLLPARRLFEPRPRPDHRRNLLVLLLTGLRRTPRYLVHGLFPTIERMSATYGEPVSARLYLRYAGRPLRALRRALRGRPASPR
jgi:hypothetical protein